ncbi:MAG: hypothetical protein LUC39_09325 [Clostridiales bacterium]|nr:hypothetical protein [Clostridiales bacterium]
MTNQWKRLLSGLLALAMTFSLFVPAMATSVEDETEDDSSVVADVAEDTAEDAQAEETADDSQPTEDVSEDAEAEDTAEPEETEEADEPADDEGSDTTSYPVSASYVADGTTVTITVSLDEGATTGNGKVTLTYSADLYTVDSTTAGSGVVLPDFNTDTAGTVSYGWVALSLSGPAIWRPSF